MDAGRERLPGSGRGLPADCRAVSAYIDAVHDQLAQQLIGLIHTQTPEFFERLVIDVLVAMGYGGSRETMALCLGRSGDGGIDGVIALDELGFDSIFIQAKRLKPGMAVPISDVRDFAGSLEAHRASKGVLVTTTHFSHAARIFCERLSRRVVLIDGARLSRLMIRHDIGVTLRGCFMLKELDSVYFKSPPERRGGLSM